ncbi:SIS domain-containing protein [Leucobacter sp. USCH14]|uniref:SIS domain-containing protein n=1 Tax=Leucobacter sp. USCH14 TaxID=3024838 RepID=UPI0030A9A8DC
MLGFNEEELREQLSSAVALRPQIESLVDQLQNIDNVLLIGSGGTYAQMWPYEYLARRHSKLPVRAAISRELIESGDAWLGTGTLAVFASASGTTEDVLMAIDYVKSKGATTVAFTGIGDSPIAQNVDHALVCAPKTWPFDPQLLLLVGRIMNVRGEFDGYASLADELVHLPDAVIEAAKATEDKASAFAEAHKDSDYYFLIGGGPLWGLTYLYSMCVLEEMQWLRTTRVNAAEFFHGSLELLEEDTPVLIFQGEDETRPLTDRAEAFAKRISKDVTVLDNRDYELAGFSPENRALIAPIVLDIAVGRFSKHLERVRNHSLDLRRYYRVMDY